MTKLNKKLRKYSQKKPLNSFGFDYEYWWTRWPGTNYHNLTKVRLPPLSGVCSDWPLVYTIIESEPTYFELQDFDTLDWVQYIPEPERFEYVR